jgi:hypothetical protein
VDDSIVEFHVPAAVVQQCMVAFAGEAEVAQVGAAVIAARSPVESASSALR